MRHPTPRRSRPLAPLRSFLLAGAVLATTVSAQTPAPPLERFTVQSDGHAMAVWARRPQTPRGAVLLVHGRTWSSRPDFDLQVAGLPRSILAAMAARGLAAYAVDLRGYGETPPDRSGWLTPRRAAADVVNVLTWVAQQHPALAAPALIGWSRGAAVGMLAAQTAPPRVSALVLFGFAFDPDLQFIDLELPEKAPTIRNTAENAASDFISPAVTPRAVVQAFVTQALRADPNTANLRNDGELNDLNPARITMPTLVLFGERDPNVTPADATRFFGRLATTQKQMVSLPGADHAAHIENTHDAWMDAVVNFITPFLSKR